MNTFKTLIFMALLSSSSLLANNLSFSSVGLALGTSYNDYEKTNHQGSITLGNTPDKDFRTYELYATLNPVLALSKKYNMKPYLSYTYSKNDDFKNQYLLLGMNKYYSHKVLDLYAGLVLGYGQLNWKYDPVNNAKNTNVDANSFISGLQLGLDYPLDTKFSFSVNTKYLLHNYKTKLDPFDGVSSSIEHTSTLSLSLGFKYSF